MIEGKKSKQGHPFEKNRSLRQKREVLVDQFDENAALIEECPACQAPQLDSSCTLCGYSDETRLDLPSLFEGRPVPPFSWEEPAPAGADQPS